MGHSAVSCELSLGLSCGKLSCKITHAASKGAGGSVPFLFLVDVPYSTKFSRDSFCGVAFYKILLK